MADENGRDDSNIAPFPEKREREILKKSHIVHHAGPQSSEPVINLPPVVKTLCLINIAVFLMQHFFPELLTDEDVYNLGFVPARYFGEQTLNWAGIVSPVTHMFLHIGWLHLSINTGMLMAFGAGLEKAIGRRKLLLMYLAGGLCGAVVQTIIYPHMESPMVGASGAISGLFGGVLMLMHSEGMMGQGYKKLIPFVLIWIGISVFFGFFGVPGTDNPIAWTAHVGGFIGGMLLYHPIRRLSL